MGLAGGGASATPPPPKVSPVNILGTELAAINADTYGYKLSDEDFAKRFPGLVATRDADIKKAYQQLTGPLDPALERDFTSRGLGQAMSAFGGGSENPDVTSMGSAGRNTVAASVANQTQGYQDTARNYIEQLTAQNPQRAFGLTGGDLVNMAILNQGNLANANQQAAGFSSALGAANAQASAQTRNTAIGVGASILSAAITAY